MTLWVVGSARTTEPIQRLSGYLSLSPLCVRILTCRSVGSLVQAVHKFRNDHGANSSFVCGHKGVVLRDHLSKMTQCLCRPASFGNSEGGPRGHEGVSHMKIASV